LATFFAGVSSLSGTPIVVNDWRITCAIAAVFTLGATIAGGAQSQLAKPELLTQASECVGKLRALMADTVTQVRLGRSEGKVSAGLDRLPWGRFVKHP
jgi:hypothetical protein